MYPIQDTSPFIELDLHTVPLLGQKIQRNPTGKKYGYSFTLGLRDGATPRDHSFKIGEKYRGIRCPNCGKELENYGIEAKKIVKCSHCNQKFEFVCATREDMGRRPPDVLITNMWTLEVRLIDSEKKDINVEYFKRTNPKEYPIRGDFFRDQTAIIHSMPFRRLKHKTQVFFSPENDHVCTRIEHVMHVATIGATICKGLNKHGWDLNIEMAFAMGLGHDLGHAPFGHAGETAINRKLNKDFY